MGQVVRLHGLLESCQFREVWGGGEGGGGGMGEVTSNITNFQEQIRKCEAFLLIFLTSSRREDNLSMKSEVSVFYFTVPLYINY